MTNAATQQPLNVSTDGTAGPYIRAPLSQLPEVKRVLDNQSIRYWVAENAVSLDGLPYIAVINLGRGADAVAIQNILDFAY